jgi:Zn-dependent protease
VSRPWYEPAVQPHASRRPSPVFLLLVAVLAGAGWLAWAGRGPTALTVPLFVIAGWIVSLCLHEYGHPLRYAHPVLSIVVPVALVLLGGIALPGGAVWIDHGAIRGRLRDSLVSLAGPLANLGCFLVMVLPLWLGADTFSHRPFWAALALLAFLQLTAALLNLLPLPGVDGGNALFPWLGSEGRRGFAMFAPYGMLILLVLLLTPRLNALFFGVVDAVASAFGLPIELVAEGFAQMPTLGRFLG